MAALELNLRDYWMILRKRKGVVIMTTVLMAILTFLFAYFQKVEPLYETTASIKVELSPPLLVTNGDGGVPVGFTEGDYVSTQARLVLSFPVMVRVAKQLGMVDEKLSEKEIRDNPELLRTVLELKEKIISDKEGVTNIVNITVQAEDPILAERIANTTVEIFRQWDFEQKNKRVDEARAFVEQEIRKVKAELEQGEEDIRIHKEQSGSVPLETQASEDFRLLTTNEIALAETEAKLKEINIILEHLREEGRLPAQEELDQPGASPSPIFQSLKDRLIQLTLERDTLLLEFTDQHPDVQALNIRIDETIDNMLEQLEAEKNTLERKRADHRRKIAELKSRIATYPEASLTLARLERNVQTNAATYRQLQSRYQDILIRTAQRVYDVQIIKPAVAPEFPINRPAVYAISLVGTFLGLLLGGVLAFVFEALDTSIGAIEDIETFLEVPVLGLVPFIITEDAVRKLKEQWKNMRPEDLEVQALLLTHYDPRSTVAESFRALRTNVQYLSIEQGLKSFVVTSTNPGEGKTCIVANLAITFAQMGKRTLLIESDLRKPQIHRMFGLHKEGGLTNIILDDKPWQEMTKSIAELLMGGFHLDDILMTPGMDNLHIITCGDIAPNPSEILFSDRMEAFLDEVREAYDYVLMDTPPVIPVSDAAILGSKVEGVIFVYEVGKVGRAALKRAKFLIENVNGRVVGIVMNKVKAEVSPDFHDLEYYRYAGHKYAYGQEEERARPGPIKRLFGRS